MKIVKASLIIVFVGFLIYLVIAILTPPISEEVEVGVDTPSKQLFNTLSDQSQMTKWVPGLKSVKQVEGVPNTVGSVSRFVFETAGQEIPVLVKVNEYNENESMQLTLTHDKIVSDVSIKVIPQGSGSKLDISYEIEGNSIMTKTAMPLIKPLIKKYSEMDLDEIKKLLENS